MTATRTTDKRLTDEQVAEVMGLIKGSDSVELKLTVPEADQRSTVVGARSWTRSRRRFVRSSSSTRRSWRSSKARCRRARAAGSEARATTRS